jgi:hypothetical protein
MSKNCSYVFKIGCKNNKNAGNSHKKYEKDTFLIKITVIL